MLAKAAMPWRDRVHELFLLNLVLQLFDGVATYQGLRLCWHEGNPLLASAMASLGAGPALLLFKAKACGFLVLLRERGSHPLAQVALCLLAAVYLSFSFVPWLFRFAAML